MHKYILVSVENHNVTQFCVRRFTACVCLNGFYGNNNNRSTFKLDNNTEAYSNTMFVCFRVKVSFYLKLYNYTAHTNKYI